MPTGRNVDLILGMKMNDFLDANKKAYIEYTKTKGQIERNPVNLQIKGGSDFHQMSGKIANVGNAFQSLGSEIKPVLGLLNQSTTGSKGLALAFVGLSDVGLRVFNVMSTLKVGVNGLFASLGPAGWIMLGITALTTAFSLFSSSTDDAKESVKGLSEELNRPGFLPSWMDPEKMAKTFGMKYLVTQQKNALAEMEKAAEKNNLSAYEKAKEYYDKITALIKKYSEMNKLVTGEKTEKEIAELNKVQAARIKAIDDLRRYEYESGRMSDLEYGTYLRSKLDKLNQNTAEEKLAFEKLSDETEKIDQNFLTQHADDQQRLTADFTDAQNKRLNEAQKTITTTVKTTTAETKKQTISLGPIAENIAGIFGATIVNQLQNGSSAAKNMGAALIKMVESFAATLLSKTIIWTFFNLITGGGGGSLLGFLGFGKGGEVTGKASGGVIDRSDIARSAFTPTGEDGLIGVQIGETIINRRATQMFAPILNKLNDIGRRGYAEGGRVTEGGILKYGGITDLNSLVDAIQNIRIEIKSELDYIQFYRNTLPKYEKIRDRNRIY